jgi:hypothetical protein
MYVTGDVAAGDRLVALGAHLMRDGKRVRVAGSDITSRDDRP